MGQLADNSIPQNGMSLYITLENETTPRLVTLYRGKLTVNSVLDDEIKSILMQDARLINQNAKWTSVVPSVINVVLLLSTITISDQTGIYSISLQSNQTVDNVISTHKFQINNTLSNIFNQISTQKYMVLVQNRSTFNMNSVGLGKVSALFNTPVSDYYFKSTFGMSANDYAALVEKYKIDYNTAINTITKGISDSSVPLPVKVNMQTSPVDFPVLFSMFNNLKNQRNVILWTAKKVNNNVTYVPSYLFTEETYNSKTGYSMKFLSTNFNTQLPVTLSNVNFFCKTSTTPSTFRGNSGNGNSYVDNLIFDCNY